MRIECLQSELQRGIATAMRAVPAHATMPILECFLIRASADGIVIFSNNLEMGVEAKVEGNVFDGGEVAVNARMISDIVGKMPHGNVALETDDKLNIKLKSGKSKFTISGQHGESFTLPPIIQKEAAVTMPQGALRDAIVQTVFCASTVDTNKLMMGEYVECEGDKVRFTTLDGHRVAKREVALDKPTREELKAIVPASTLREVSKILAKDYESVVDIGITKSHILFELPEATIVSRLVEGQYFDVGQMIARACSNIKATFLKRQLADCIDRAIIFTNDSGRQNPIIFDFKNGECDISAVSQKGNFAESLSVSLEGDSIKVGFNPNFLLDVLKVVEDEEISLHMSNSKSPCMIKDDAGNYLYLVLPVAIQGM